MERYLNESVKWLEEGDYAEAGLTLGFVISMISDENEPKMNSLSAWINGIYKGLKI